MLQQDVIPILQDEGLMEMMFQQDGTPAHCSEAVKSVLEYHVSTEMDWHWGANALATKFTCIIFSGDISKLLPIDM